MKDGYSMILSTCAEKQLAKAIAKQLVEKRLAACVQIFPIESVYMWKGEICDDNEIMLFIKSKTTLFKDIVAIIKANHSYEVPEIVQIPITDGLPEYLKWINDYTNGGN